MRQNPVAPAAGAAALEVAYEERSVPCCCCSSRAWHLVLGANEVRLSVETRRGCGWPAQQEEVVASRSSTTHVAVTARQPANGYCLLNRTHTAFAMLFAGWFLLLLALTGPHKEGGGGDGGAAAAADAVAADDGKKMNPGGAAVIALALALGTLRALRSRLHRTYVVINGDPFFSIPQASADEARQLAVAVRQQPRGALALVPTAPAAAIDTV
jgi:hypothetical protein